jgi:hypothetical protein
LPVALAAFSSVNVSRQGNLDEGSPVDVVYGMQQWHRRDDPARTASFRQWDRAKPSMRFFGLHPSQQSAVAKRHSVQADPFAVAPASAIGFPAAPIDV